MDAMTLKYGSMLELAVEKFLHEDEVEYDVTVYPLPTDDGWAPSVFLYLMIQPVEGADGCHFGHFTSPYGLTQAYIDAQVNEFAEETKDARAKNRARRRAGAKPTGGVVLD